MLARPVPLAKLNVQPTSEHVLHGINSPDPIDVDFIRGSLFQLEHAKQPKSKAFAQLVKRILFFPICSKYWIGRLGAAMYVGLSVVFLAQAMVFTHCILHFDDMWNGASGWKISAVETFQPAVALCVAALFYAKLHAGRPSQVRPSSPSRKAAPAGATDSSSDSSSDSTSSESARRAAVDKAQKQSPPPSTRAVVDDAANTVRRLAHSSHSQADQASPIGEGT